MDGEVETEEEKVVFDEIEGVLDVLGEPDESRDEALGEDEGLGERVTEEECVENGSVMDGLVECEGLCGVDEEVPLPGVIDGA